MSARGVVRIGHHLPVAGTAAAILTVALPHAAAPQASGLAIDPSSVVEVGDEVESIPFGSYGLDAVRLFLDGGVVVVRQETSEVSIYGPDGRRERTLAGRSAGQLEYITGLAIAPPDTILVYDVPARGALHVSRFLRSGQDLGAEQIGVTDGLGAVHQGALGTGVVVGLWTKPTQIDPGVETSDTVRIGLFDRDTVPNPVASFVGIRRQGSPVHFSPHPVVAVIGDTIFYSNGLEGLVQGIAPDGSAIRSFQLPVEGWTPDAAFARLEPQLDRPDLNPEVRSFSRGEVVPAISDMLAGPDGTLWVKVYDPATDSHSLGRPRTGGEWLVLDTQGAIQARVSVPDGFRLMDIGPDRVAGVVRDSDGERAAVLTLTRRRPAA